MCTAEEMDPVHEEDGKWYFYDESWAYRSGPFENEETARKFYLQYVALLNGKIH